MSRIRITGGEWRSRLITVPDAPGDVALRPTPDRVRETLFNWLGHDLRGESCLDLFAGSGILGFEAASRGAWPVVMVEKDRRVFAALKQNAERLSEQGNRSKADSLPFKGRVGVGMGRLEMKQRHFGNAVSPIPHPASPLKGEVNTNSAFMGEAPLGGTQIELRCADALKFAPAQSKGFDLIFLDPPYGRGLLQLIAPSLAQLAKPGARLYVEAEMALESLAEFEVVKQGQAGQVFFHLLEHR